eukprot:TRINITY_DN5207_c0_g1_i1.p1 TRINITY_DN5207_c0_g1~~TRINITY_DN5207_c0_g1_i1.p1  ORF type:complete len:206 (-),score=13.48 TRINITY_DN5207_c0_g1_i1:568-1185(-)
MGACVPAQRRQAEIETEISRKITWELRREQEDVRSCKKLLLLGTHGSGQSTLLRQLFFLFGIGYTPQDRLRHVPTVHKYVLTAMQALLRQMDTLAGQVPLIGLSAEASQAKDSIINLKPDAPIDSVVAKWLQTLWQDPSIQSTYDFLVRYQLDMSSKDFFDRIETLAASDFCPSDQDIVRARVPSSRVEDLKFSINQYDFHESKT